MNPADAADRVADFFCDHKALMIVGDWPDWKYRCQRCGRVFDSLPPAGALA